MDIDSDHDISIGLCSKEEKCLSFMKCFQQLKEEFTQQIKDMKEEFNQQLKLVKTECNAKVNTLHTVVEKRNETIGELQREIGE